MRKKVTDSLSIETRTTRSAQKYRKLLVIGWREWVRLPELGVSAIKAKIDTGAKTSALHAYDIEEYQDGSKKMVRFKIHPDQRDNKKVVRAHAHLVDKRLIRDSGGKRTLRPVIETDIMLGPMRWKIQLTLINRDEMGFRMLLGREAVKGHLLVHPSKSFIWVNS